MDRNLALEAVSVTEAAALAAARFMGMGDEKAADEAAVSAMRRAFDAISFAGRVHIGEGAEGCAPMLYVGERVGAADSPRIDIALDALEGTTICATGGSNALSVIAFANEGNFLNVPDIYMEKIVVGPKAKGAIDIDASVTTNLKSLSEALDVAVGELTVIVLDRPRHAGIVEEIRENGARVKLIADGDVSAAIATCKDDSGIDMLIGTGGAPEGVIAAAALSCLGGDMQGRLKPRNNEEIAKTLKMGIDDVGKVYKIEELAAGEVMFAATGVTDGDFLKGVRFFKGGAQTHSVVMRSRTGTIRFIESIHRL
ncbi:MAG: class II fructose-bisphosphatase [bacterium]|nr:class II fructose-bisphosphatase [bacterium]